MPFIFFYHSSPFPCSLSLLYAGSCGGEQVKVSFWKTGSGYENCQAATLTQELDLGCVRLSSATVLMYLLKRGKEKGGKGKGRKRKP